MEKAELHKALADMQVHADQLQEGYRKASKRVGSAAYNRSPYLVHQAPRFKNSDLLAKDWDEHWKNQVGLAAQHPAPFLTQSLVSHAPSVEAPRAFMLPYTQPPALLNLPSPYN